MTGEVIQPESLVGTLTEPESLVGVMEYGTVRVVENNYDLLQNKPTINDVELTGNKTSEEIGVLDADDQMTVKMINDAWSAIFD